MTFIMRIGPFGVWAVNGCSRTRQPAARSSPSKYARARARAAEPGGRGPIATSRSMSRRARVPSKAAGPAAPAAPSAAERSAASRKRRRRSAATTRGAGNEALGAGAAAEVARASRRLSGHGLPSRDVGLADRVPHQLVAGGEPAAPAPGPGAQAGEEGRHRRPNHQEDEPDNGDQDDDTQHGGGRG